LCASSARTTTAAAAPSATPAQSKTPSRPATRGDAQIVSFETSRRNCARDAYQQAGITDPRHQLALAEVHDCFTPTELVLMEDLGFAERGTAWKEVLAGAFALDGDLPVNPDGGLKSFGHPVGASGLRMMFEAWLQLRREAPPERQLTTDRTLALTHNLGGYPGEMVAFVSVVGSELS
jgi:acetyl-CoA C-acetyltransferase